MKRALVLKLLIITKNIHFDRKDKTKEISSQPGYGICAIYYTTNRKGILLDGLLNN
jgi:hypothetical protein